MIKFATPFLLFSLAIAQSSTPIAAAFNPAEEPTLAYQLGVAAGIKITDSEIEKRKSLYEKLGDRSRSDSAIKIQLVSEKYIKQLSPGKPNENQVKALYTEYIQNLDKSLPVPSFTELAPMLELDAFLQKEENLARFSEATRQYEEIQRRIQDSIAEVNAPQPMPEMNGVLAPKVNYRSKELQINSYADDCIAYVHKTGDCVLTVEHFNRVVLTMSFTKDLALRDARQNILEQALHVQYLAKEAREKGFIAQSQNDQRVKERVQGMMAGSSGKAYIGSDKITQKMLEMLYKKYYDSLYSEREVLSLKIMASTDSVFMDTTYKTLKKEEELKKSETKPGRLAKNTSSKISKTIMPWTPIDADQIPTELLVYLDSLSPKAFTKPVKTSIGYCILLLNRVDIKPEVSFDEVRDQLFQMALEGKTGAISKISDVEAQQHYKNHLDLYKTPDTVHISFWLYPSFIDTAHSKPWSTTSVLLPKSIAERVLRILEDTLFTKSLYYTLDTEFGLLNFKNTKIIPGGLQKPFASVKSEIIRTLNFSPQRFTDIPREEKEQMLVDESVALFYWQELLASTKPPSDAMLVEMLKRGELQAPGMSTEGLSGEMLLNVARQIAIDKIWRVDMEKWLSSLSIDESLFNY